MVLKKENWLDMLKSNDLYDLPTPYMVTDLSLVRDKVQTLQKVLPGIDVYYAIKSNAAPEIITEIDDQLQGYDIASLGEFEQLKKLGVDPSRILYSNPVKVPSHIKKTYEQGVRYYAFDSLPEVEKLKKYAPEAIVYLRVRVSDYGSKFPLSKKFGVDPIHVASYAEMAKEAGLQFKGLTFHVGSQSESSAIWESAFESCGKLIKELKQKDIEIEFVDMGGGLPADYAQPIPDIEATAKVIRNAIKKHIPSEVRILAEPGRYVSADSSVIVSSVIGREHRSGTDWLYLDMGVFQGLMEPLEMSNWKYPTFTEKDPNGYQKSFVLTGPTCDACDTIGHDYVLPSDMNVGDRVYIGATGAYSLVYSSNFNGFKPPKQYYLNKQKGTK